MLNNQYSSFSTNCLYSIHISKDVVNTISRVMLIDPQWININYSHCNQWKKTTTISVASINSPPRNCSHAQPWFPAPYASPGHRWLTANVDMLQAAGCPPPHLQTPSHVLTVTKFTSVRRTGNGSTNSGIQQQMLFHLPGCLVPPVMFGGGEESWGGDVFPGFGPTNEQQAKVAPEGSGWWGATSAPRSSVCGEFHLQLACCPDATVLMFTVGSACFELDLKFCGLN